MLILQEQVLSPASFGFFPVYCFSLSILVTVMDKENEKSPA